MSFSNEMKEETIYVKKWIIWLIVVGFLVSVASWFLNRTEKTTTYALIQYEQFQEIYNTCNKLNTDLCNMREMPDDDKSFEQFTKPQRINTLKTQLNRWVQDYNAKSNMWTRSMWKSSKLPYELDVNQFNCYITK